MNYGGVHGVLVFGCACVRATFFHDPRVATCRSVNNAFHWGYMANVHLGLCKLSAKGAEGEISYD
jgi:hypothetical protein